MLLLLFGFVVLVERGRSSLRQPQATRGGRSPRIARHGRGLVRPRAAGPALRRCSSRSADGVAVALPEPSALIADVVACMPMVAHAAQPPPRCHRVHPQLGAKACIGSASSDVPPNRGGEPLRRLSIARPVQLRLASFAAPIRNEVWADLPAATKGNVVALLARLVARGVVAGDGNEEEHA